MIEEKSSEIFSENFSDNYNLINNVIEDKLYNELLILNAVDTMKKEEHKNKNYYKIDESLNYNFNNIINSDKLDEELECLSDYEAQDFKHFDVDNLSKEVCNKEYKDKELLKKVKNSVCKLKKNFDGSKFIFTELNLSKLSLDRTTPYLNSYNNIRYLNLSHNNIKIIEDFSFMKYLTGMDLSFNKINNITFFTNCKYYNLKNLNLSNNNIEYLNKFNLPKLNILKLNNNQINKIDNEFGLINLEEIELRNNKLVILLNLTKNNPNLKKIYCANNSLISLEDLHNLKSWELIHMRNNPIEKIFKFIKNPNLKYINLRETKVADFKEILNLLKMDLDSLNLWATPLQEENGNLKKEILMINQNIKKINKEEITKDDTDEALEEIKLRKQQEEEERELKKQQEEEERELKKQQEEEERELKKQQEEEEKNAENDN